MRLVIWDAIAPSPSLWRHCNGKYNADTPILITPYLTSGKLQLLCERNRHGNCIQESITETKVNDSAALNETNKSRIASTVTILIFTTLSHEKSVCAVECPRSFSHDWSSCEESFLQLRAPFQFWYFWSQYLKQRQYSYDNMINQTNVVN